MKTLVILAHPDIENSRINKKWKEELEKYPDEIKVHELYKEYPDWNIDVEKEHKLIEGYDNIILQFPVYWYSCPPLLKKWFDDVWTFNWAYGPEGDKLKNRKIGLAISAGSLEESYTLPVNEILSPFRASTIYVGAEFLPRFSLFGTIYDISDERVAQSSVEYVEYIKNI